MFLFVSHRVSTEVLPVEPSPPINVESTKAPEPKPVPVTKVSGAEYK